MGAVAEHSRVEQAMGSDTELLAQFTRADAATSADAFAALVSKYTPLVYSACLRILNDAACAEDAAQAAFLVFFQRARSLPPNVVLSGWLYCTAQRCAATARRTTLRRQNRERELTGMSRVSPEPADPAWHQIREQLDAELARLPATERETVVLRYFEGLSSEETARKLGCEESTVRARLHRALESLRARLRTREALSAMVLAALLTRNGIDSAPASLAGRITAVCQGTAAATPTALACARNAFRATVKLKLLAAIALLTAGAAIPAVRWLSAAQQRIPVQAQRVQPWLSAYYQGWGNSRLPEAHIPWTSYTHIMHFQVNATADGSIDLGLLTQSEIDAFTASKPEGKKALISIRDQKKSMLAATKPQNIGRFVQNIVDFVRKNKYDGVDLLWYDDVEPRQYSDLIHRLRTAAPDLVLTMSAYNSTDLEKTAVASQDDLDQINAMCYDLDMDSNSVTWHNSALESGNDANRSSCQWRVSALVKSGVRPQKIGIGVPFYGRRWTGATEPCQPGATKQNSIPYSKLIRDQQRWLPEYQRWDSTYHADYLAIERTHEFISYTGERALNEIVQWRAREGFGGINVFAINYDFVPTQGAAAFPLTTVLYKTLMSSEKSSPRQTSNERR